MGRILTDTSFRPVIGTQSRVMFEKTWITDTYTTPGDYEFVITGDTGLYIEVECWGPGSHGQNITVGTKLAGNGGNGGGYSKSIIRDYKWTKGYDPDTSPFYSGTTIYFRVAEGGTTDSDYLTSASFYESGYGFCEAYTRTVGNGKGDIVYSGGTGANDFSNSNYGGYKYYIGGGGGEGASPSGNGNNAVEIGTGPGEDDPDSVNAGRGGSGTDGADGGKGRQGVVRDVSVEGAGNGYPGTSPGGGGGGCYADGTATKLGGNGGNGQIKISYYI
jgi:hypothetical protein